MSFQIWVSLIEYLLWPLFLFYYFKYHMRPHFYLCNTILSIFKILDGDMAGVSTPASANGRDPSIDDMENRELYVAT